MTGWIGISLGDVTGIGPEVTLKALAADAPGDDFRYLLIGDAGQLDHLNRQLGLQLALQPFRGYDGLGRIFVHDPGPQPLPPDLVAGSPAAANASVAWLKEGAERCLR